MQATIRGWSRNHGEKVLIEADVAYMDVREGGGDCEWKKTYFDIIKGERPRVRSKPRPFHTIRVTASAELNLNGAYMVQVELNSDEIARLFYLTHGAEEGRRALKAFEEAATRLRNLYGRDADDAAA
jgi:hypothetical protein